MLQLSLFWLLLGLVLGTLAQCARWGFSARGIPGRKGWLATLAVGGVLTVLGGWLGALLLGRLYGTPTALWVGILAVVFAPWLWARMRRLLDAAAESGAE